MDDWEGYTPIFMETHNDRKIQWAGTWRDIKDKRPSAHGNRWNMVEHHGRMAEVPSSSCSLWWRHDPLSTSHLWHVHIPAIRFQDHLQGLIATTISYKKVKKDSDNCTDLHGEFCLGQLGSDVHLGCLLLAWYRIRSTMLAGFAECLISLRYLEHNFQTKCMNSRQNPLHLSSC